MAYRLVPTGPSCTTAGPTTPSTSVVASPSSAAAAYSDHQVHAGAAGSASGDTARTSTVAGSSPVDENAARNVSGRPTVGRMA